MIKKAVVTNRISACEELAELTTPLTPPTHFIATPRVNRIDLTWKASSNPLVTGYKIRQTARHTVTGLTAGKAYSLLYRRWQEAMKVHSLEP